MLYRRGEKRASQLIIMMIIQRDPTTITIDTIELQVTITVVLVLQPRRMWVCPNVWTRSAAPYTLKCSE